MTRSPASERLSRAASTVVEFLESRCLFSVLVPNSSVLVFNDDLTSGQPSHTDVLTLTNTGSSALTLGGWTITADPSDPTNQSADFHVISGALPSSLAAGASAQISVNFTATVANTVESALLKVTSSDPSSPTTIQLHGLGTNGQYGYNEPSLANILTAFDIPTNIGVTDPSNSQYPETPSASSQEVPMQRLVAAGTGPVTITPLASFNSSVATTVRFGYYTPGDPTDTTELFTIGQSDSQAVNPNALGATSFNPGTNPFGLYAVFPGTSTPNGSTDIHYSEDALNTLDPSHSEKFRFFPMETANGTIVPNTYVVAAEDYNSPTYNSFTNFVGIISNVKPASDATNSSVLGLTNLSGVPSSTRLVFNRIQNPNPADPAGFTDTVHDSNTLQINNTGDQTLVISSMTLSDTTNWEIVNPPTYPLDIAPGGTADVTIKFIAQTDPPHTDNQTNDSVTTNGLTPQQAGGVWDGTLTLNSNDPVNPARTVQLAGYWQDMSENENEPGLQTIVNSLFGYGTNISNTQQPEYPNNGSQAVLYGEEVASGLWQSADPSLPVTVLQIDAYHNQFSDGTEPATLTGWYASGNSNNVSWLFQQQPGESQSLLPTIDGSSTAPAEGSFSPTGAFGFDIDGERSQDSLNTTDINTYGRSGHAVRFYPVRTSSGALVPNEWLMVMDYQNGQYDNSDFQDNAYLVTNLHPATQAPAPQDAQATAGAAGILLQWQPVADSTLQGYNVYRSSSINGTYTKLNSSPITTASYVDTTAPAGATSYYRITAIDSSGESEAANASATASAANVVTTTLGDSGDAYVQDGTSANTNFGSAPDLQVKVSNAGYNHESYITFNLSGISGSVTSATLNLFGELETAGAGYTVEILPTTGSWSESTITWNTKPTDGTTALASATVSGTTGAWYTFNLTSYIQSQLAAGNTTISLAIAGAAFTSGGYADFNSREAGSNTPQLVVTSAPNATAPPTPSSLNVTGTTSSSVSLSWAPSNGATSYAVLRKGPTDSAYTTIATPTGTSYTDSTAVANTTYSYEVEAASSGLSSAPTSPVSATTGAGATATFVKSDTSTSGNWTGVYGADGYDLFDGPASIPSYAQVTSSGANAYVWQSPTSSTRAPQNSAGSSSRTAACFFSPSGTGSSFTLNVNLSDGNGHQVALYLLDWDSQGRAESVQVTDASSGAVLSTQSVSNFSNGTYLVWNLTGSVKITVTCTGGLNAVASGLFFSPVSTTTKPATASFIKTDSTTAGTWTGVYGGDGYDIFNGATSLPSYAQVTPINASNYTWASPTSDTRALQNGPSNSSRIAACDFSSGGAGTSFSFNVNLTDGNTHQVALYLLDWDGQGRAESVQITDAKTGAVLSTQSASNFKSGQYLVWNLSGNVNITVTCTGGLNAVASGLFFGAAPATQGATATLVKTDTTTGGTWTGVYGADGYSVFNDATNLPSYARLTTANNLNYTWASPTTDPRALQDSPSNSNRIAACDFSSGGAGTSFSFNVNLTDGKSHQVALYLLDWDRQGRTESVQISDATSGAVLSTQSASNFSNGQYLVWNITGNVKITITCTGGLNAVASGLFFGA